MSRLAALALASLPSRTRAALADLDLASSELHDARCDLADAWDRNAPESELEGIRAEIRRCEARHDAAWVKYKALAPP